ncbi:TetR family transcriptional regulator [Nocardia stercoris]|uniref:TetR family transcriptional regulator n=2 Tax=Nocardia stercoris TaxID=2483361 RepID=A0A3M2KXS8_9NOCA|nr:TetR family transcriptional regulator [Nocardia stercoris]
MDVEGGRSAGTVGRRRSPANGEQRVVRRRPKNRRAQIAAEAAAAFGSSGYHGVSMEDIAGRLGISSAALYRHYPSKYALFREELQRLAEVNLAATVLPEEAAAWTPQQRIDHVLSATIATMLANRTTVALARWEQRYLERADRKAMDEQFAAATTALRRLIGELRPELDGHDRAVRAVAIFSVISSIGDHHTTIPAKPLTQLLKSTSWALIRTDLPAVDSTPEPPPPVEIPESFKHELLLKKAVDLFKDRGYANVSMEDIASAADLSAASAVYRYYRSKSTLLAAAFRRAGDRVSGAIGPAVAAASTPADALSTLIELYVAGSFEDRALTYVYYSEFSHVDPEDRATLRHLQHQVVAEWAKLVVAVRPELTIGQARILVHAAFGLVIGLGRVFGDDGICPQPRVVQLLGVTLFGQLP